MEIATTVLPLMTTTTAATSMPALQTIELTDANFSSCCNTFVVLRVSVFGHTLVMSIITMTLNYARTIYDLNP